MHEPIDHEYMARAIMQIADAIYRNDKSMRDMTIYEHDGVYVEAEDLPRLLALYGEREALERELEELYKMKRAEKGGAS